MANIKAATLSASVVLFEELIFFREKLRAASTFPSERA
jgi:hypothetical protein